MPVRTSLRRPRSTQRPAVPEAVRSVRVHAVNRDRVSRRPEHDDVSYSLDFSQSQNSGYVALVLEDI